MVKKVGPEGDVAANLKALLRSSARFSVRRLSHRHRVNGSAAFVSSSTS